MNLRTSQTAIFLASILLVATFLGSSVVQGQGAASILEAVKRSNWQWSSQLKNQAVKQPGAPPGKSLIPHAAATSDGFFYWWYTFQSYRDGNFEIYLANDVVREFLHRTPVRLTANPAADTEPALSHGGDYIAFVSDRAGNPEIYRMNSDGSALQRLTADSGIDAMPTWGVDPNQPWANLLYFVSDRDGNPEIYRMADGGGIPKQLTFDEGVANIYPTLTADGRKLAWVRYRGEYGVIWIADSNGSNAYAASAPLRFLAHLTWSPDGTQLAFDYDHNGDGYNRIAIMKLDGTPPLILGCLLESQTEEQWAGSWMPDGKNLLFNRVFLTKDQLAITGAWLQLISTTPFNCSGVPLELTTFNFEPYLANADPWQPHTRVRDLPQFVRSTDVPLSLYNEDVGRSGISNVKVEFRPGYSATWSPVGNNGGGGLDWYFIDAAPVGRLHMRVRADDDAGNSEPWPAGDQGDVTTTAYFRRIDGVFTDQRGNGLAGRNIEVARAPLVPVITNLDGHFTARLGEDGEYRLNRTVVVQVDGDRTRSLYALPDDNLVTNGGFESAATGWTAGGSHPPVPEDIITAAGSQSMRFGSTCAGPCTTDWLDLPAEVEQVTDPFGNTHIFYVDQPTTLNDKTLTYRFKPQGGDWQAPIPIDIRGRNRRADHAIAATGDGAVHLFWVQAASTLHEWSGERIAIATRTRNGTWQGATGTGFLGYSINALSAVGDSQNGIHLAWQIGLQPHRYYSYRNADGNWSEPEAVGSTTLSPLGGVAPIEQGIYLIEVRGVHELEYSYRFRSAQVSWSDPYEMHPSQKPGGIVDSTLSQTVKIPGGMSQPTLSFLYSLHGGGSQTNFDVRVSDVLSTTTVFSSSVTTPWTLGWADLAAWSGQQVTITFTLHQATGDPVVRADLDEVSVSAWTSPVVGGVHYDADPLLPGAGVTLTGINFAAASQVRIGGISLDEVERVDEHTIHGIVPFEVEPGWYQVEVINPDGNGASLPMRLRVGRMLFLPMLSNQL